jgi:hypothetical protein
MGILDWSKDATNANQYFMMMPVPINVLKKKDGAGISGKKIVIQQQNGAKRTKALSMVTKLYETIE